jgi:nucleoside-diphosphate-sugar epimerase
MSDQTFAEDLEAIMTHAERDLLALRGADILITGGTGFVGTWLVSALCHADHRLHLGIRTTILTRDPIGFADRSPQLAAWATLLRGDVTTVPPLPAYNVAIHAATPASAALNDDNPDLMRGTIVDGMRSLLEALEPSGSIPLLFTSSGAVYGPQPVGLEHTPEEFEPIPDAIEARNAYALGKRDAEAIALAASHADGPSLRLARLFAFVGPHLPLNAHFAIGNFVRDAIAGGPIRVAGDGSAVRSYLYAGDMIEQLLAILVRGLPNRAYNIGSEEAITIRELAALVGRELAPKARVEIAGLAQGALPTGAGSRYVPATTRIADELGCRARVDLPEAIRRTAASHSV